MNALAYDLQIVEIIEIAADFQRIFMIDLVDEVPRTGLPFFDAGDARSRRQRSEPPSHSGKVLSVVVELRRELWLRRDKLPKRFPELTEVVEVKSAQPRRDLSRYRKGSEELASLERTCALHDPVLGDRRKLLAAGRRARRSADHIGWRLRGFLGDRALRMPDAFRFCALGFRERMLERGKLLLDLAGPAQLGQPPSQLVDLFRAKMDLAFLGVIEDSREVRALCALVHFFPRP